MSSQGRKDSSKASEGNDDNGFWQNLEKKIRKAREPPNKNGLFTNAMDDLVKVNSLFLFAVFLGISIATPEFEGLDKTCKLSNTKGVGKELIYREVLAFACLLFSSLLATSLKVYLNIHSEKKEEDLSLEIQMLKWTVFSMSMFATVAGVGLLTVSMADIVRIKVGRLLCGSPHALTAVILLALIVAIGVSVYLYATFYTLIYCSKIKKRGSTPSASSSASRVGSGQGDTA